MSQSRTSIHRMLMRRARDMSCATILGRPSLIDWGPGLPTRAIDVVVPPNRRNVPLVDRDPLKDPPTPVTKIMWLANMTKLMRDIQQLQDEGPFPKDFSKVDILHSRCLGLEDAEPAFLRMENADKQCYLDTGRKDVLQTVSQLLPAGPPSPVHFSQAKEQGRGTPGLSGHA